MKHSWPCIIESESRRGVIFFEATQRVQSASDWQATAAGFRCLVPPRCCNPNPGLGRPPSAVRTPSYSCRGQPGPQSNRLCHTKSDGCGRSFWSILRAARGYRLENNSREDQKFVSHIWALVSLMAHKRLVI